MSLELYSQQMTDAAEASLWCGTAKDFLDGLPDESVDLIVTSPPYFVGKEYDTSSSLRDFQSEIRNVLPSMLRVLRPGGNLCWQVGNHVANGRVTPLDAVIVTELISNDEIILRNRIIWTFGHGTHASSRFSGRHETILWYSKGSDHYFDVDEARVPQLYPGKRHYKGPKKGEWSGNPKGKNPGDVWDIGQVWNIPNVKSKHIEKTGHPCQFPTALVRRLIGALSPAGGLVVDPYVGSGSTAVAALLEDRSFEGNDLEKKYLQIAEARIQAVIDGTAKVREDEPVRVPDPNESVAKRPEHFHV